MKQIILVFLTLALFGCTSQKSNQPDATTNDISDQTLTSEIEAYYTEHTTNSKPSISTGNADNGSIENSKLIPFKGENYHYFDSNSYLLGRAFTHDKVLKAMLDSYLVLEALVPEREFCVMECSNEFGGKLFPHRTHQNGMSIDFMMPKLKNGKPDYSLDGLGAHHYLLEFNADGILKDNSEISIDFNTIALHLILLEKYALNQGLKIKKVIINTSLKDELYASEHGKELKKSQIYLVQNLSKLINDIHDDHYHVDFELIH